MQPHGEALPDLAGIGSCPPKGTFPDHGNTPAGRKERVPCPAVAGPVAVDLVPPEIRPGAWKPVERAVVTVPETAMHEDGGAVFWQHDIRLSWQFPDVKAEPESFPV